MIRFQYAKPWLPRIPATIEGNFRVKQSTNKYRPHQGRKEMARRRKQLGLEEVIIYKPM